MKGIVFNLLEEAVSKEYGEETWDSLLDTAGLEGSYTAVGTYPDEELASLVDAAAAALSISGDQVVQWFGNRAIPMFASRYPAFFEPHVTTRDFVLTLNDVIHPEVRKLFPGAYAPQFHFDDSDPETLILGYESHRHLCSFAEGLLEGAAAHFGESVELTQTTCSKRGDERCTFECRFSKLKQVLD